jgi:hypothetical protein
MEQEEEKQARRPTPTRRPAYAARPVQMYYQPAPPSLLSKALKWTLVVTILGGVVFGALTLDHRFHISETIGRLKAKQAADGIRPDGSFVGKRAKTKDAPRDAARDTKTTDSTGTAASTGVAAGAATGSSPTEAKKDE